MNTYSFDRMIIDLLDDYALSKLGFTVTRSLVRFSLISTLTPIAKKYSSRKTLTNSLESSETKTNVKSFTPFLIKRKKLQTSSLTNNSSGECTLVFNCSQ